MQRLIEMTLAHVVPCFPPFLSAALPAAEFLFGSMCDAQPSLHSDLGAPAELTFLPCRPMSTAETGGLDVLVAARMLALFALGAMSNAKPSLDDTVDTVLYLAPL